MYWISKFDPVNVLYLMLTYIIFSDLFFNRLRTEQQLGYLVGLAHGVDNEHYYIYQKVQTTFDINLNAQFNERFWVGASYRNEDAIVGMLGMNITEKLKVGYSYDFTTSELKNYSDGTHEIMLGYCFMVKKKVPVSIKNVRFL